MRDFFFSLPLTDPFVRLRFGGWESRGLVRLVPPDCSRASLLCDITFSSDRSRLLVLRRITSFGPLFFSWGEMEEGDRGVLPVSTFFSRRCFSSQPYARLLRHTFSARPQTRHRESRMFLYPFHKWVGERLIGGRCRCVWCGWDPFLGGRAPCNSSVGVWRRRSVWGRHNATTCA